MSSTPLVPGLTVKDLLGLTKLLVLYARFRVDSTFSDPELVQVEIGTNRRVVYGVVYDDNPADQSPGYLYALTVDPKKLLFFRAPVEQPDKGFVKRQLKKIGYDRQEGVRFIGEIQTPTKASRDKVEGALEELRTKLIKNEAVPTSFPVLLRKPSALPPPPAPRLQYQGIPIGAGGDPPPRTLPPPLTTGAHALLSMIRVHYRW